MNTTQILQFTQFYNEVFPESSVDTYVDKLTQFFGVNEKVIEILQTSTTNVFKKHLSTMVDEVVVNSKCYSKMTHTAITRDIIKAAKEQGYEQITSPIIHKIYTKATGNKLSVPSVHYVLKREHEQVAFDSYILVFNIK